MRRECNGKLTHLWFLSKPLGATFNSSSIPKMFCRSPLGWRFASPNNSTKAGAEIILRSRLGLRRMLFLWFEAVDEQSPDRENREYEAGMVLRRETNLIIAISFFPGCQLPAAMRLWLPDLTREVCQNFDTMEREIEVRTNAKWFAKNHY